MRFKDSSPSTPGQLDFVPRERRSQIWNVVFAFSITIIVVSVLFFASESRSLGALGSLAIVGLLCIYIIYRKQQSLDLVMSTEYQNMLYAQALSLGSIFCLIARRDGTIVHASNGVREVFPNFSLHNAEGFASVLERGGLSKTDRDRVMHVIYNSTTEQVFFPLEQRGEAQTYAFTLEPLPRPSGYTLVRGRVYQEPRAGKPVLPEMLRSTSPDKLNAMLEQAPVGLYVTDAYGRVEYGSPYLEHLLQMQPGELRTKRPAIQQLLEQIDGTPLPDDYTLAEHHGEALLRRTHGMLARVGFHQTLLRDTHGKVVGATGTIIFAE